MAQLDFDTALEPLLARDPRYQRAAYHFVREALDHAQRLLSEKGHKIPRHVSGAELLDGIRDLALKQFGPMACCVLEEWGITRCEDFGELVFNMIEHKILKKTDQDSREDFRGGFNFDEAFRRPFVPAARSD